MKIGFTGTQVGMTPSQKRALENILRENVDTGWDDEFHYGDCQGADAQAFALARAIGYMIVQHPPINKSKRAFTKADVTRPAKEYLARNHNIVDACELLIAAPKETEEQLRSGTWATIRYARKRGKKIIILQPN